MRAALLFACALLALSFVAPGAQAAGSVHATLVIDVDAARAESMTLTFDNLARLTEYHDLCMPEGARLLSVRDDVGDVPHTVEREDDRVSITFRARAERVDVRLERDAATGGSAPFHTGSANFCTTSDSRVDVVLRVAEPLEVFFASRGGVVEAREARWSQDGPIFVTYGYEAPVAPAAGLAVFDEGIFRVAVPNADVASAREVAVIAADALDAALADAGLALPWPKLRVHFGAAEEFGWESGHYGGDGILAVKPKVLRPDPREGYPYVGAKVLVHEAFHAASAPFGKGDVEDTVAWLLEGSARYAERRVDAALPEARRHCETTATRVECWFFDDRITMDQLEAAYAPSFRFERDWEPSLAQDEETRRFYYAFTEYLVASYVARQGLSDYRSAWDDIEAAFATGAGCPCGDGWVEGVLVDAAGNLTEEELLRPRGALHDADRDAWRTEVRALAAADPVVPQSGGLGLGIPHPAALALVALAVAAAAGRRLLRRAQK